MKDFKDFFHSSVLLLVCYAMIICSCGGSSEDEIVDMDPPSNPTPDEIYTEPTNILLMYNGLAFYCNYGADTQYFYWKSFTQEEYNKMTEAEVRNKVITGEKDDQHKVDYEMAYAVTNCKEKTQYVIVTVSYGKNDEEGEMTVTPMTTKSSIDQPVAEIDKDNVTIYGPYNNQYYYEWTAVRNTYCSKYYTYAAASSDWFYALSELDRDCDIFLALEMKNEISKNGERHSTNINTWGNWTFKGRDMMFAAQVESGASTLSASTTDKYLLIVTWGASLSDELSGIFDWVYYWDFFSDSASARLRKVRGKNRVDESRKELSFDTRALKLERIK